MAAPTIPLDVAQLDFACRISGIDSHNQLAQRMRVNRSTVTRALTKGEASPAFIARLRTTFPGSTMDDFCAVEDTAVEVA